MRVIYSTPRLENAERVASLLEAEGIGIRVLHGPHFRRQTWRGVDYQQASNPGDWPRVLVLNNGDLPQARATLRAAGVMAPAAFERPQEEEAADAPALVFQRSSGPPPASAVPAARRIRYALLGLLLLVIVVQAVRHLS